MRRIMSHSTEWLLIETIVSDAYTSVVQNVGRTLIIIGRDIIDILRIHTSSL